MTARPVHFYCWDWFDAQGNSGQAVVPSLGNVTKTVRVSLRNNDPEAYAATIAAEVNAAAAAGNPRVALRLWQEIWVADETAPVTPRYLWYDTSDFDNQDNWWFQPGIEPYVVPQPPQSTLDAWSAFGAAWRAQNIPLDYLVGEEEQEIGFDGIRGVANRTAFFEPITSDPESPYFGLTNIGNPSSNPLAAQFRDEYNAWGYPIKAAALRTMHGPILSGDPVPEFSDLPWSNYKDRPGGSITKIYSPPMYINVDTGLAVPPEYTTDEQVANYRRWHALVERLNQAREYLADESEGTLVPWIGPIGLGGPPGADGAVQDFGWWAPPERVPFEILLFRVLFGHLATMGVADYIQWNAEQDINRAANCAFLDPWAQGRSVGAIVRSNPQLEPGALTITTEGEGQTLTTRFADLYEMDTVYYTRGEPVTAWGEGWPWSQTEPLVISPGAAGDAELAAMVTAIEATQGTQVQTREIFAPSRSRRAGESVTVISQPFPATRPL